MALLRSWTRQLAIQQAAFRFTQSLRPSTRCSSSSSSTTPATSDPASLLSKPIWSVKSLLPESTPESQSRTVTPKELGHLLRLSALPQPSSPAEEEEMLKTLESQIHFVKEIQRVDTTDVSPLRSIRDETAEAQEEGTIHLRDLEASLGQERYVGRSRRIQRTKAEKLAHPDGETWDGDALKSASKTMGRFFVVQSSKESSA
ncbi:hypothetical protein AJ80_02458 [Polytolypa hystricis UAMH7299]|uniref:Glutamyl-tRNA amidotransferase complex subunit Gta3 domain-containing protein n=1 Tax=Polytolypa hystricis (strain UAMH7299) TaxID=1447883 RepID=A0A2B7YHE4_POLH7|nr:hypothetical protein AJ80_02458 [Polytolypa hystricis UAMH7299]